MRFSTSTILALPLLAAAAESPFEQYKAQFQNFLGSFGVGPAVAAKEAVKEAAGAAAHAAGTAAHAATGTATKDVQGVDVITLNNWNDTLYSNVKPGSVDEWWVFVTGGNKTCFGTLSQVCVRF